MRFSLIPSAGKSERAAPVGGETLNYPFEDWRYRHVDGLGDNVRIEFVDPCQCGVYVIQPFVPKKP